MNRYRGPYVTWLEGFTRAERDEIQHSVLPTDTCMSGSGMNPTEAFNFFKDSISKVCIKADTHEYYARSVTSLLVKLPNPDIITFNRFVDMQPVAFEFVNWMRIVNQSESFKFNLDIDTLRLKGFADQNDFISSVLYGTHSNRNSYSSVKTSKFKVLTELTYFVDEIASDPAIWVNNRIPKLQTLRDILDVQPN